MHKMHLLVLALCVAGAACAQNDAEGVWFNISPEKSQQPSVSTGQALPVQLPIRLGGANGVNLPVLLLPVPVPVPTDTCSATGTKSAPSSDALKAALAASPFAASLAGAWSPNDYASLLQPQTAVQTTPSPVQPTTSPYIPALATVQVQPSVSNRINNQDVRPNVVQPSTHNYEVPSYPQQPQQVYEDQESKMFESVFETSEALIASFWRQTPASPGYPASQPTDRVLPGRGPAPFLQPLHPRSPRSTSSPPRPVLPPNLVLRAELTVPRAEYTEVFTAAWDGASGATRVVFEDGSTVVQSNRLDDKHEQFLEIQLETSGPSVERRCTLSTPQDSHTRGFPALPNLDAFEFDSFTKTEGVERWIHEVQGAAGQSGGASGESLHYTHELLLTRSGQYAIPLKYSVIIDSSILGEASDGYIASYSQQPPLSLSALKINTKRDCDSVERLTETNNFDELIRRRIKFQPLMEFTLPVRDTRYDAEIIRFQTQFNRNYKIQGEEAIRKNIIVQHARRATASNRLMGGFTLGVNFLADRLDEELERLMGIDPPSPGAPEAKLIEFPYLKEQNSLASKLPEGFDYRTLGAVSPVQLQGVNCSSCWAFAVAGAVEGALWKRTKRLVPLSVQCLVDCAHQYGTKGCGGSWPSHAYEYVRARGLPAAAEYSPYAERVLPCGEHVPRATAISGHYNVTPFNVDALKISIQKISPNVVIVDARSKSFILYSSGVLKDERCTDGGKGSLSHAVLAVGWGGGNDPYFILKNSWSAKWGEGGYVRTHGPTNTCGVLARPSAPKLTKGDIRRNDLKTAANAVKNVD